MLPTDSCSTACSVGAGADMAAMLEIVAGLLLGYALASTIESVMHEYVADAAPKIVAHWRRYPRLFQKLINTHLGHHVVHHHQTYLTTHVRQFETLRHRTRVTGLLLRRGRYGRIVVGSDFGLRLLPEGAVFYLSAVGAAGSRLGDDRAAHDGAAGDDRFHPAGALQPYGTSISPYAFRAGTDRGAAADGVLPGERPTGARCIATTFFTTTMAVSAISTCCWE